MEVYDRFWYGSDKRGDSAFCTWRSDRLFYRMGMAYMAVEETEQHDAYAVSQHAVFCLLQCEGPYFPCGWLLGESVLVRPICHYRSAV